MKLWMSGEVQSDVADQYREARKEIESALNDRLSVQPYGEGLGEWAFIAIIRQVDDPKFDEVMQYDKKEREFEFRLRIPHAVFKASDDREKRRLIVAALLRCVHSMNRIAPGVADVAALEHDVLATAESRGWG